MSKIALRKDLWMEIRRTKNRFISVFMIVALGVAFFSGVRASENGMVNTADALFDQSHLMDIRIVSTLGLTDADAVELGRTEGVRAVEPSYMTDVLCGTGEEELVLQFQGITTKLNLLHVVEGRMPKLTRECLIDNRIRAQYAIGDTITVSSGTKDPVSDKLITDTYEVVGYAESPMLIGLERGSTTIGSGQIAGMVYVIPGAFASSVYTQIFVQADGAEEALSYSHSYETLSASLKQTIENMEDERCESRYQSLVFQGQEAVRKAEEQLQEAVTNAEKKLQDAREKLDSGWEKLQEAEEKLEKNTSRLEKNRDSLSAEDYEASLQKIKDAQVQLSDSRETLETGEEDYEASLDQYQTETADAEAEIADGKQQISEIEHPKWYVYDREDLPGYTDFGDNARRIGAIGKVFPVIFFLVAALVCLTTMTRMVEEQRTQMGTLKALGYGKGDIAYKYLIYALIATVGGSVCGVLAGEKIFPFVIVTAYRIMYQTMHQLVIPYQWDHALIASGTAILCTMGATWATVWQSLRAEPAELMRPLAPKAGKRVFLERIGFLWKHFGFTQKATIRNLFRYKKRFFMTIFGIGSCMGLLVVGFGLKDSIMNIADIQYDNIQLYDGMLALQPDSSDKEKEELRKAVESDDRIESSAEVLMKSVDVSSAGTVRTAYLVVAKNAADLEPLLVYRNRVSHELYSLEDGGALVSEQLAQVMGTKEGEALQIRNGDEAAKTVTVTHIIENYLMHYIYMTAETYEALYGEAPEYNMYFIGLNEQGKTEEVQLGQDLMKLDAAALMNYVSTTRNKVDNMLKSLYTIVIVLVISAGLLAFVVLYNLNNINISERRRELATIKLLGFYDPEVAMYVYRENVYLTLIGAFIGIFIGKFLHRFIIDTIQVNQIMFGQNVSTASYLICAGLTVLFAVLVNLFMYFQLKKIDMVESLKSVE